MQQFAVGMIGDYEAEAGNSKAVKFLDLGRDGDSSLLVPPTKTNVVFKLGFPSHVHILR